MSTSGSPNGGSTTMSSLEMVIRGSSAFVRNMVQVVRICLRIVGWFFGRRCASGRGSGRGYRKIWRSIERKTL
jgi:hypothetical protein